MAWNPLSTKHSAVSFYRTLLLCIFIPVCLLNPLAMVGQSSFSGWRDTDDSGGVQYRWKYTRILAFDACEFEFRDLRPNDKSSLPETSIVARVDYVGVGEKDITSDLEQLVFFPPKYAGTKINGCHNVSAVTLSKLHRS